MSPFLLLLAAAIVILLLSRSFMRRGDVTGAEARALVEGGARLLDVRTAAEFAAGHLPGAVNIPLQELDRRVRELGPKDAGIVVYCLSGHRSQRAHGMLVAGGFTAVHDLGAMRHW
ncbi:MAG: rhodanese-like domain-containing protein [Candidatus Eisenbacteria bacterium]